MPGTFRPNNHDYADYCIYTIRHSDAIKQFNLSVGPHTIVTKRKPWTGAKKLIADARKQDKVVPLLFARAEDTTNVVACADLLSVQTGAVNKCTFDNVRYLSPTIRKTKLRKRDGTNININFIRDYAICQTPTMKFASSQRIATAIPEEIPDDEEYQEGVAIQVLVNRYERDPAAREKCIKHYGAICTACGISLVDQYGPEVNGLIHVHHLAPLASIGKRSSIDPVRDLRPVCPNCHAVIHSTKPPRTIEQVKKMVRDYSRS